MYVNIAQSQSRSSARHKAIYTYKRKELSRGQLPPYTRSGGNYLQREILLLVAVGILHGGLQLGQTGDVAKSGLLDRSV